MTYYPDLSTLPDDIRTSLPLRARVIYMNAFNRAWEGIKIGKEHSGIFSRVDDARQYAWAAVLKVYKQDVQTRQWKRKTFSSLFKPERKRS